MGAVVLAVLVLLSVHGPQGQLVSINVEQISSIRDPRKNTSEHFATGTKCLVYMTNGHFIGTTESCLQIIEQIVELDAKEK
jgi:hypothetical protein